MSEQRTVVTDPAELRRMIGAVSSVVRDKDRDELSDAHRDWLAASPYCVMATASSTGRWRATPRGDRGGVARVLDKNTVAIADRPGNRRVEAFLDLLDNPSVGLLFLIPGRGDTLRIEGRASLVTDAPYFDDLIIEEHRPDLVVEIVVDRVYFHCSKAAIRAELWDPETWRPDALPGAGALARSLRDQGLPEPEVPDYAHRLY